MIQSVVIIVIQTFTIAVAKNAVGLLVLSDYSFHWPFIACFHDLFKFTLAKLTDFCCKTHLAK